MIRYHVYLTIKCGNRTGTVDCVSPHCAECAWHVARMWEHNHPSLPVLSAAPGSSR